jgi:2'-5' RNA ligase
MPAKRNLFFALSPAPPVRAKLAAEVERLHAAWGGRATQPAKLHMTLVFLDTLPEPLPPDVVAAARAAATMIALPPFDVVVDRADRFGRRIGWLGCSRMPDALQRLHDTLAQACSAANVPMRREERYVPHVTALRDPRRPDPQAIAPMPWRIDAFQLMASAEGAYETLGDWPLRD